MTEPMLTLVPRVRPVVELGVGDSHTPTGTGVWGVSHWNQASATWVGIEPLWLDVSCYVQNVTTFCGHERSTDSWRIGTAEIILKNETGWADYPPTNPDADPLLTVRPGRQVRVGVYIDGAADPVWLWRGYTDEATPDYDPVEQAIVTLSCIDAKGEVGRTTIAKLDTPIGASEVVTNRITRILNAASWSIYRRSMQTSGITLQATTLGGKAADLMDIAADSGGGAVFGDMNGRICYRNRDWQMYPAGTPVAASIGNVGDITAAPASDGYLTATVSGAFTPDPVTLPGEFVFIMKVRGPVAGSPALVGQWPSVFAFPANSWFINRSAATGALTFASSTDGISISATQTLTTQTPTGADEYLALAVDLNNGSSQRVITAYTSSDLGNNWTLTDTDTITTAAIYDAVDDLEVGVIFHNAFPWDSRIYWIELQEGLVPNGGDMIWRFDANDAYGFDSFWTDPEAREWHVDDADAITDYTAAVLLEVCPNEWETSFARADMATRVHIARATDDAPIAASDDVGITLYGVETYDRLDLETELDAYLSSLAVRHLEARSYTTLPRVVSVTLDASRDGVVDVLAIADPRNAPRFRCRHVEGSRTVFDKDMFAVAIEHRFDADTWTARISLDDASAYTTLPGGWGTARWQRSVWST